MSDDTPPLPAVGTPITAADVYAVADQLAQAGERPSAAKVRDQLGRGSMTTIQGHLAVWRQNQVLTHADLDNPAYQAAIQRAVSELTRTLLPAIAQELAKVHQRAAAQAQVEIEQLRGELAEAASALDAGEALRGRLEQERDEARQAASHAHDEAREAIAQCREATEAYAAAQTALAQSQEAVAQADQKNAALCQECDALHARLQDGERHLSEQAEQLRQAAQAISQLTNLTTEKDKALDSRQLQVFAQQDEIMRLKTSYSQLQNQFSALQLQRESEVSQFRKTLFEKNEQITELQSVVQQHVDVNASIQELRKSILARMPDAPNQQVKP
jgi:chromosome segregation ATPase